MKRIVEKNPIFKKVKILSWDEQKKLLIQYAEPITNAKDKQRIRNTLVVGNLPFIIRFASSYVRHGFQLEDAIHEAVIGFIEGIEKFQLSYGVKLTTYATWRMRNAIQRERQRKYQLVKISDRTWKAAQKSRKEIRRDDREPTEKEIELFLSITFALPESMEKYVSDDLDTYELMDTIPSECSRQDEIVEQAHDASRIKNAMHILSEKEKDIIYMRFGFVHDTESTLSEIGIKYGVSRERIRQIEKIAMKKIRDVLVTRE